MSSGGFGRVFTVLVRFSNMRYLFTVLYCTVLGFFHSFLVDNVCVYPKKVVCLISSLFCITRDDGPDTILQVSIE